MIFLLGLLKCYLLGNTTQYWDKIIFIFLCWTSLYWLGRKKNSILLYHKKHAVDYGTATSITSNIRVMPYMSVSRTYRYSVFYSVPILNSLYYRPDFGQVSKSKLTHDLDLL